MQRWRGKAAFNGRKPAEPGGGIICFHWLGVNKHQSNRPGMENSFILLQLIWLRLGPSNEGCCSFITRYIKLTCWTWQFWGQDLVLCRVSSSSFSLCCARRDNESYSDVRKGVREQWNTKGFRVGRDFTPLLAFFPVPGEHKKLFLL